MSNKFNKLKNLLLYYIIPEGLNRILMQIYKKLFRSSKDKSLSEVYNSSRWQIWRENIINSHVYFEFGVGNSTVFAANNFECHIYGVDTDVTWINNVILSVKRPIDIKFIDLGETLAWGRPSSYKNWNNFVHYISPEKLSGVKPDLVLIDGRFRVACFLSTLLHTAIGTKIIFDDYPKRSYYHIVEMFIKPTSINSHQALFEVVKDLNKEKIADWLSKFYFVMD